MATYTTDIDLALLPGDADRIRVRVYVGDPDFPDGTVEVDHQAGGYRTWYPMPPISYVSQIEDEHGTAVLGKEGK